MPSGLTADGQSLTDGLEKEEISQLLTLLAQDAQVHHQLEPVKPDIIGEYLVLDYINQKSLSVKCKQFIAACWEKRDEFLAFLSRCVRSYLRDFSGLIFGEHPILFAEADPWAQAIIMFGMTTLPDITFCQKAINVLESLYNQYQEPSFALVYASGLVNLSAKLDVNEAAETIERLKSIVEQWPDNQAIALVYASGLFNLSAKQEVNEAAETIERLKSIAEQWPDNQAIALEHASGLVNLSAKQDVNEAAETIERLKSIVEQWPDNQAIALVYASGLFNFSAKQDVNEAAETIERLKSIAEHWPDNQEIALRYALGLFNLSAKQDVNEAEKTIDKLKTFSDNWPNSQEIVQVYTMAQFYFSRKQAIKNIISYQSSRD
ncbi:MAG: hypothetical protein ACOX55_07300 [Christensenellales bacterium]